MFCQVATIVDKDGYTNLRKEPNPQSEIIGTIKQNRVFWYSEDYFKDDSEWIGVFVSKNQFSIGCGYSSFVKGYIHRSRILAFEDLETHEQNNIIFNYSTKPFTAKGKIIEVSDEGFLTSINGLFAWGTDGEIPTLEIDKLELIIDDVDVKIPDILKTDLYQKLNEHSLNYYKIWDTYFIKHFSSDGAGAYEVVWVVEDYELKQRLVGNIY
jgi:hypothetical protein